MAANPHLVLVDQVAAHQMEMPLVVELPDKVMSVVVTLESLVVAVAVALVQQVKPQPEILVATVVLDRNHQSQDQQYTTLAVVAVQAHTVQAIKVQAVLVAVALVLIGH